MFILRAMRLIELNTEKTGKRTAEVACVSDGRIEDLTIENYEEASGFNPALKTYWPDAEDLVRRRIAKVFVEDGRTKGICYTCFCSRDVHEPHIVVDAPHRGKGIGKLLTLAYAKSILTRGCRLFWSHYTDNVASARCARAAGFEPYGSPRVIQYVEKTAVIETGADH